MGDSVSCSLKRTRSVRSLLVSYIHHADRSFIQSRWALATLGAPLSVYHLLVAVKLSANINMGWRVYSNVYNLYTGAA